MGLFVKIVIQKNIHASLDNVKKALSASWNVSGTFRISRAHPPGEEPPESVWGQKSEGDLMSHLSPFKEPMGLIPRSQVAAPQSFPLLRGVTGMFSFMQHPLGSLQRNDGCESLPVGLDCLLLCQSDQLACLYDKTQNRNTYG